MGRLIVALGNPGVKYQLTRHNIGWLVMDYFERQFSLSWKKKFDGEYCEINDDGEKIYFLKPMTFMNLSGESVQKLSTFYKVARADILVIHDDIELPFGTVAFKKGGGLAGHNGLRSMSSRLGGQDFLRFRLGVGRPEQMSVSSWVLSNFHESEMAHLEDYTEKSSDILGEYIRNGFDKVEKKYKKHSLLKVE